MISQLFCHRVRCSSIQTDDSSYCIRPCEDMLPDSALTNSIKQTGLLHPPLLQKAENNSPIIVSGRKRVLACISLGIQEIPCLFIERQTSPALTWKIMLSHSLVGNGLSIIEQANFFNRAARQLTVPEQLDLLPLLGRKPQPYILEELRGYLSLAPAAIIALHSGQLQEKTAKKLAKLQYKDQETLIELIQYYSLGGTKQKKLTALATELIMRTGQPLTTILKDWNQDVSEDMNRPQQATALLRRLKEKCFPRIHGAKKEFARFQQELSIPDNIDLQPAASFEDDTMKLSLTFNNRKHLLTHWQSIKKIMETPHE